MKQPFVSPFLCFLCFVAMAGTGKGQEVPPSEENLLVQAPIGPIKGSLFATRLGKPIYSFRGVRYAEPPTGQQRFQQAVPVQNWTETFDASEEGPACPCLGGKNISENCLRLNIYTTKLPSSNDPVKRPVLVFFHPGGFYSFSSQSSYFGPQYLLDQDIVLVTVNYRLGSLGFLSTGDSLAPGNLGLKDQVEGMRWVQRNIAAFGGDPDSVTISGYSVGGWSVALHLVSPMSRGLFHRAICMSGSTMMQEPLPTHQKHLAVKQAQLLGCPTDTTGNMILCLNSKPVENFTDTLRDFFDWYGDPIVIWSAVIEPEVKGVERFLAEQPVDLIRRGEFAQVPLITGVTKDEFGGAVVSFIQEARSGNDSMFQEMNNNWDVRAPSSFLYERGTNRSLEISHALKHFYFDDKDINEQTADGLAHIYADSVIIFPMHRLTKLVASASKAPVYFYKFTYQGRYSFSTWGDTKKPYGVVHHDDLQYLFYLSFLSPMFEEGDPEYAIVDRQTKMWANFVKTGNPIPPIGAAFRGVVWEPYSVKKDNFLDIGENLKMQKSLYPDRMREWEKLFPLPPLNE